MTKSSKPTKKGKSAPKKENAAANVIVPLSVAPAQTKLVRAKTKKGKRFLENRAPKLVEDPKRVLVLYGNNTSQVIKDALADIYKLKGAEGVKFSRKNEDCRPFETGGEVHLEFYSNKTNCSLFAMGSHTKKRPNNLVLGRMFDFHLYDAVEFGIENFEAIKLFKSAGSSCQLGSKPCIIFQGEKFESVPALKLAKSLLLDVFRGPQVDHINLAGLDRVMVATAVDDTHLLLRQYSIKLKKSGTRIPRVALTEVGPRFDLAVRRHKTPVPDLEKEAMKHPKLGKKKEKNVGSDLLAGKVGRIYMPKQTVDKLGLAKLKGAKRERRQAAADRANAKKSGSAGGEAAAAAPSS